MPHSQWTRVSHVSLLCLSFSSVQDLIKEKEFKTFVQLKPFEQFEEALKAARQGYKDGKVVLTY